MGKGGDLWDDSALVDALDRAVSTFKAMHGKDSRATPCENEKPNPPASAEQKEPISAEATDDRKDKSIDIPCGSIKTLKQPYEESKTIEQAPHQETEPGNEIHISESKILSSDLTDADRNISSSQQGEYNELLRRYYELEEQSRNVLQQLQQTTGILMCHTPLLHANNRSQPTGNSASMPPQAYGGCSVSLTCDQCPGTSTTYPTASNFMQPPTKLSINEDEVTKAAMMTAEGALNFMKSTIFGDPASQRKESETGKKGTSIGVQANFDITGADSDLAVILNAWFLAGFHTGRYLEKKQ